MVIGLELRGRGDTQLYRVELPGPKVSKGYADDERLHVSIPRSHFNELAADGKLKALARGVRPRAREGRGRPPRPTARWRCHGQGRGPPKAPESALSARELTPERLARLRAASQLLARPARNASPADVLRSIGGAQSQDQPPGRLQVRVRSKGLTAADIERARLEERSIIRHWVMRMTVHLFPVEDFGWLTPLFKDRIVSWSMRRLEALGLTPAERDRALAAIRKTIQREGAVTRNDAMEIAEAHRDRGRRPAAHAPLRDHGGGRDRVHRTRPWPRERLCRYARMDRRVSDA